MPLSSDGEVLLTLLFPLQVNISDALRQTVDNVLIPLIDGLAKRQSAGSEKDKEKDRSQSRKSVSLNQAPKSLSRVDSQSHTSAQITPPQQQQQQLQPPQSQSQSQNGTSQVHIISPAAHSSSSSSPASDPIPLLSKPIGRPNSANQLPAVSARLFDECAHEVLQLIETNGFSEYRESVDFFPCYVAHQMSKANAQWLPKLALEDRRTDTGRTATGVTMY